MTKELYLHRLREALHGLPREERENAMRYCEEYFDEAGLEQFDQAAEELGTPETFAADIRKDYQTRTAQVPKNKERNSGILILLAFLTCPVWLPIAAVILVVLSIPILFLGLMIFIFFGLAGFLLTVAARLFFVSWASAGLALGATLICGALFLACLCLMIVLIKKVAVWIKLKIQKETDRRAE